MKKNKKLYTAEFVTPKHPDKQCDIIADTILDAYRAIDPFTRGAVEVMGGHGMIKVNGEITSSATVDVASLVREMVGDDMEIIVHIAKQSPEIAQGVDTGGAGDQGIMIGYACSDTENCMPYEYELARNLCKHIYKSFPYDGKVQITAEQDGDTWDIKHVVASFQNASTQELLSRVQEFIPNAGEYHINVAGDWSMGGFDADAGLTGRKIVVDAYGPRVPVGGGAFSGKDHTKVDRSGAYMARKIAKEILRARGASEVLVKLAYVIGKADPVKAVVVIDGSEEELVGYDLTPKGIHDTLKLRNIQFADLAHWGHFGNEIIG
jgi:S-adenosylmethionine synthetase